MRVFLDTSAVVPLVLNEPTSSVMHRYWTEFSQRWAWDWIVIEAEAALIRQKADPLAWRQWGKITQSLTLIELDSGDRNALRAFNRSIGLRAADAGHLFLFERLSRQLDGLQLLTFDRQMIDAACALRMDLHVATDFCP
jgi:predicted nucleic acid-binding protein